jgi:hypothetical protein
MIISNRKWKGILDAKLDGKTSSELVNKFDKLVENVVNQICNDLNQEYELDNNRRKFYHLKERKIIDATLLQNYPITTVICSKGGIAKLVNKTVPSREASVEVA